MNDQNEPAPSADANLSHVDKKGQANMVNIGSKGVTERVAKAECYLLLNQAAYDATLHNNAKKGDVIATARIAGIMAAKRTAEVIPLCHPLKLTSVTVDATCIASDSLPGVVLQLRPAAAGAIHFETTVHALDKTGVEMEAIHGSLIAATVAYDMLKAVDKLMVVGPSRVTEKRGGASGDHSAPPLP